jgi:hypothetical protein
VLLLLERNGTTQETMLLISPHENVTMLYGVVIEPISLIVEFCDGGALDRALGLSEVVATTFLYLFNFHWIRISMVHHASFR